MDFKKECQALILAGGLGKRLRPITETIPKPMVEINGKPFLEHILNHLKKYGIRKIILCVGYLGDKIEEYFGDGRKFGLEIKYSYEQELLGTAGAIKNAEHLIETENFIVLNGDTYSLIDIDALLKSHNPNFLLTMVVTPATNPQEQELVEVENGKIIRFLRRNTLEHEKYLEKNSIPLINAGFYVFNKSILNLIPKNEKVSLEKEIFPSLIGKIGSFEYKGYFKDIADSQLCKELEEYFKIKRMNILVTGAGGMMGSHILDFLVEKGHNVLGIDFVPTTDIKQLNPKATYVECDIRDRNKLTNLLNWFKPNIIFHFAAQSYPTVSWQRPEYTIETNVLGTINLFEAVKELNLDTIILNAGSSAEYGYVEEKDVPVKENRELKPLHPYGVSKVAQELLAYQYYKNFGIKSITIRIFNTTGPKKINDVCSDFTKQIVLMEKGFQEPILFVGNVNTKRAITDVRDLIEAFWLAVHKCDFGESYNVSGEKLYLIKDIIEILRELTPIHFDIQVDQKLIRPTDEPVIYGDSTKFKEKTGWAQKIDIKTTLKDMLDYWRKNL
jgi:GDP-mannose 4,6-dehydratase